MPALDPSTVAATSGAGGAERRTKSHSVATRDEAIEHLQRYAALADDEAAELVDAVSAAAGDEAIDAIAEAAPAPTAINDARAARIVRICRHLAPPRLLRPIEVAVLFRMQPSAARLLINRVRAAYPQLTDEWTRELIAGQAGDAEDISTDDLPDRWRVSFNDPVVVDYAYDLLAREGMTRDVIRRRSEQALEFPRVIRDRRGDARAVLEVLGLQ